MFNLSNRYIIIWYKNPMNTPILITAWRRVEKLEKLLKAIKANKPKKIYISCDGPRNNNLNDQYLIEKVKRTIDNLIDWDCEILKQYNYENLGCRGAMIKAINWFFEHESEGIILEDDCIPNKEFIPYCSKLLKKYKKDHKVWNISGTNLHDGIVRGDGSYYLSKYFIGWGWATWRDRWLNFDSDLKSWAKAKEVFLLKSIFSNPLEIKYWTTIFNRFYKEGIPDTWDIEWAYTCFVNEGNTIIPNVNLIKNIGFDKEATHTKFTIDKYSNNNLIFPLIHPTFLINDKNADKYTFYNHYQMGFKRRIKFIHKKPLYYPKMIFRIFIKLFTKLR